MSRVSNTAAASHLAVAALAPPTPLDSGALAAYHDELVTLDVPALRQRLAEAVEITAHHVARMALAWRELERRGEDLSALRTGMGAYLSAVAAGRLLPEAVVRLAGNRTALRAIALLSLDEQQRLLAAGAVQIKDTAEPVPLHRLRQTEISRAFDTVNGRVLTVAEQKSRKRSRMGPTRTARFLLFMAPDQHAAVQKRARDLGISAAELILRTLCEAGITAGQSREQ